MESLYICPVCSGDQFQPYITCTDHTVSRETFQVVRCEKCGFRFTNPRPAEGEIGKYYQSEAYISHSGTTKGLVNKIYGMVRNYTIKQKVKLINAQVVRHHSAVSSILDLGCGTGEFLHACKLNGWEVTGIEPSADARKHMKFNFGIEALPGDKLFDLGEKRFHAITLWHVLEHIHQLHKTIGQLHNALRDEGVLIAAVPNCNSFDAQHYGSHWAAWDLPRHLYHFTEKDIQFLFSRFGFKLQTVLPMKFDSYYVSLLSEKYRSGTTNLMRGFISGLKSNLSSGKPNGYSSQIYCFVKSQSNNNQSYNL